MFLACRCIFIDAKNRRELMAAVFIVNGAVLVWLSTMQRPSPEQKIEQGLESLLRTMVAPLAFLSPRECRVADRTRAGSEADLAREREESSPRPTLGRFQIPFLAQEWLPLPPHIAFLTLAAADSDPKLILLDLLAACPQKQPKTTAASSPVAFLQVRPVSSPIFLRLDHSLREGVRPSAKGG